MKPDSTSFQLENVLSQLLKEQECLIIPNFGGFVANYRPAQILEEKNQIVPPGKTILFNPLLNKNDGLLAQEIMLTQKISYQEAILFIEKEIDRWNLLFTEGARIILPEIGTLVKEKNQLVFQQDIKANLLDESFGYSLVTAKRIKKEGIKGRLKEEIEYRQHSPNYKNNFKKVIYSGMAAVLVLGAVIWSVNHLNPLQEKSIELKTTISNWFNSTEKNSKIIDVPAEDEAVIQTEVSAEIDTDKLESDLENEGFTSEDSTALFLEETIQSEATTAETSVENHPELSNTSTLDKDFQNTEKQTIKNYNASEILHYKIVAGCFQSLENAEAFVLELQSLGYDAQIAGTSSNGLNRVIYSSHNSKIDAMKQLAKVRLNHNVNAWMTSN